MSAQSSALKKKVKNRKNVQKHYYSGKKKKHTLKSQIIVNASSEEIICTDFSNGKTHDFKMLKDSRVAINPEVRAVVDSGYTGMDKIHANCDLPKKKSKHKPLTKEEKNQNKELSIERVLVENIFSRIKRFKVFAERYRSRRKRFGLRFNLICSIQNFELQFGGL